MTNGVLLAEMSVAAHRDVSDLVADEALSRIPLVSADAVGTSAVLDIRQDQEFTAGHVPGARHVELGEIAARAGSLRAGPTVVMCRSRVQARGTFRN